MDPIANLVPVANKIKIPERVVFFKNTKDVKYMWKRATFKDTKINMIKIFLKYFLILKISYNL